MGVQNYSSVCLRPEVTSTAIKLSLFVGTVLMLINHLPAILDKSLTGQNILQILLTYLVPYCVSTYSSVKIIMGNE